MGDAPLSDSIIAGRKVHRLFSREAIAERVAELGRQISHDYSGKEIIVVGVLKGAWVFMADLVRQLRLPVRCDFVRISSYGDGTDSSGKVNLVLDVTLPIRNEHVLIVEDIVDTGTSMPWLVEHLREKGPASIRICCLLNKPARRKSDVKLDYVGFDIDDYFVVGYGIDCAECHRELDYIGYVE
jgi:hypoxanthine phosphoribosyltransferase